MVVGGGTALKHRLVAWLVPDEQGELKTISRTGKDVFKDETFEHSFQ
jgi:hypothetical protein